MHEAWGAPTLGPQRKGQVRAAIGGCANGAVPRSAQATAACPRGIAAPHTCCRLLCSIISSCILLMSSSLSACWACAQETGGGGPRAHLGARSVSGGRRAAAKGGGRRRQATGHRPPCGAEAPSPSPDPSPAPRLLSLTRGQRPPTAPCPRPHLHFQQAPRECRVLALELGGARLGILLVGKPGATQGFDLGARPPTGAPHALRARG
jgi:hypothetical protein